ncbi:MAG: hypothetical protein KatS3mg102_2451 [Planctomycetota bacterium]|nr:MAG: hypothetical protein KatS3mg102_2451 [Planctomycetota bacterium]
MVLPGASSAGSRTSLNHGLTAILGHLELLRAGLAAGTQAARDADAIRQAAERAADLTRQLLAFSRQQPRRPRVLDLNQVVREFESMLRRLIGEDVEVACLLAEPLGRVEADRSQLEQVLMNLAVNARDAMPEGGKLTIETANVELDETYTRRHSGVTPGAYVMLAVSDTGIGMDAETRARIFEPFFTTKEPGRGTGLGLATAYGIVRQSKGHIWVYSEPGRGSTFKVYLPRVEAPLSTGYEPETAPAPPGGGTETLLLVEDDPGVRRLLERVLAEHGYRVLVASDGAQALAAAERHPETIHLLVTDVVLPGMSGPELAQALLARRPGLRTLYLSGYPGRAVVRHEVLPEGASFLSKPFRPADVLRRVREVLQAP